MGKLEDRDYYRARAEAEGRMAALATESAIADLHIRFAEAYERRLRSDDRINIEPEVEPRKPSNVIPIAGAPTPMV